MARNVFKALGAADDGGDLNANESTEAVDMTNVEKATFGAVGAFGGGTLTLEIDLGNGQWVSSGKTLAAAGKVDLDIPCKKARWTLTGAAGPDITCACSLRTFD